jgi:hypothetical protein
VGTPGARERLIRLLQHAHAGELAAAHAYEGHARSVADAEEKRHIERIRLEELDHRERVAVILATLGAAPDPVLERRFDRIGRLIGLACRVGGWYVPMYGAGRLERGNVGEYEVAARLAIRAGLPDEARDLVYMAEAEWDHEAYFRTKVLSHWMRRVLRVWPPLPRRFAVAGRFERFARRRRRKVRRAPADGARV